MGGGDDEEGKWKDYYFQNVHDLIWLRLGFCFSKMISVKLFKLGKGFTRSLLFLKHKEKQTFK